MLTLTPTSAALSQVLSRSLLSSCLLLERPLALNSDRPRCERLRRFRPAIQLVAAPAPAAVALPSPCSPAEHLPPPLPRLPLTRSRRRTRFIQMTTLTSVQHRFNAPPPQSFALLPRHLYLPTANASQTCFLFCVCAFICAAAAIFTHLEHNSR
jgi:hypothetical protein